MKFVNEPVLVEARIDTDGKPRPMAFVWEGRRYEIADRGRTWTEDGTHRFLVMTPDHQVFELALLPDGRWMLARAPERSHMA